MSRSRKKHAVSKDRGLTTQEYWSVIRQEWKRTIKTDWYDEDMYLRNPKEIINDWNYCDWKYRTLRRNQPEAFGSVDIILTKSGKKFIKQP